MLFGLQNGNFTDQTKNEPKLVKNEKTKNCSILGKGWHNPCGTRRGKEKYKKILLASKQFDANRICEIADLAAVVTRAQLEGSTLGGGAVGDLGIAAAHLDLVQRAVVLVLAVEGAGGHGAGDAGIGMSILIHLNLTSFVWYRTSMHTGWGLIQTNPPWENIPPGPPGE